MILMNIWIGGRKNLDFIMYKVCYVNKFKNFHLILAFNLNKTRW